MTTEKRLSGAVGDARAIGATIMGPKGDQSNDRLWRIAVIRTALGVNRDAGSKR